jgi:hypothetical protein
VTSEAGADVPAGWYPDPEAPESQRWWDGQQWALPSSPPVAAPAAPAAPPPSDEPIRRGATLRKQNTYSLVSFAVVAAYLFFALVANIIYVAIFPIAMSLRALRGREPLAPLALAASVAAVVAARVFRL